MNCNVYSYLLHMHINKQPLYHVNNLHNTALAPWVLWGNYTWLIIGYLNWHVGNYVDCLCNLNHHKCVNLKCTTDTMCQRIVTVTNNRIQKDDMFCSENRSQASAFGGTSCNSTLRGHNGIILRYCCEGSYCNGNNTYLLEFITAQLGVL